MGIARLTRGKIRKLGCDCFSHDYRTSRAQHCDHAGITGGSTTGVQHGAVFGRHISGVEDILDADGYAMECSGGPSLKAPSVGCARLRKGMVWIEKRPRLDSTIDLANSRETSLDELLRTDDAAADHPRRFGRRE